MAKVKDELLRQQAIKKLQELFADYPCVDLILRHVSDSGMTRYFGCYVLAHTGISVRLRNVDDEIATALGLSQSDAKYSFAVKVKGTGQDMAAHLMRRLSNVTGHEALKYNVL